jgi:hypothetical protein
LDWHGERKQIITRVCVLVAGFGAKRENIGKAAEVNDDDDQEQL